jgi:hypothetical protein
MPHFSHEAGHTGAATPLSTGVATHAPALLQLSPDEQALHVSPPVPHVPTDRPPEQPP